MSLIQDMYDERNNIERVRKNFNVTIELNDKNVYDIYFRNVSNDRDDVPEQSAVLQYIFINEKVGCLPSLLGDKLLYVDVRNGDVVLKTSAEAHPVYYEGYEVVTYDMFDGARWSGLFSYPPTQ
jgi:hypothetical protein